MNHFTVFRKNIKSCTEMSPTPDVVSWREIVQRRIESNTRRFARGRSKPEPVPKPNRLVAVAGQFFYPLMTKVDKSEPCIDLLERDTTLLFRLLYTLAIVLYSSMNIPVCTFPLIRNSFVCLQPTINEH